MRRGREAQVGVGKSSKARVVWVDGFAWLGTLDIWIAEPTCGDL